MKAVFASIVVLATFLLAAGGCLVISVSQIEESGNRVSPDTLLHIEPGVTTEHWLLAALGEPTSRRVVEQAEPRTELLLYTYRRDEKKANAVFLIFAGGDQKFTGSTTYIELVDGIVQRYWIESLDEPAGAENSRDDDVAAECV